MGFDITDKIKMRAAKTFIPPLVDLLESKLPDILADKKNIVFENDEQDVIVIAFEIGGKIYLSLAVIDSSKRLTRALWTKEIQEVVEMFLKSK